MNRSILHFCMFSLLLSIITRGRVTESCINSRLKRLRNCHTFSKDDSAFYILFPPLCIFVLQDSFNFPHRHLLLSVFFDIASLVGVELYFILVSTCISPCGSQCWGSFLCPLSTCMSSLEKSSKYFCPSFNCTLYLLLLTFKTSISILDVSVSYTIVKECLIWGCLFIDSVL